MTTSEKDQTRQDLLDAARAFHRAQRAVGYRRTELHRRIIAAVRAGNTKSQVARDTGYTREYVTKLVDEVKNDPAPYGEPEQLHS